MLIFKKFQILLIMWFNRKNKPYNKIVVILLINKQISLLPNNQILSIFLILQFIRLIKMILLIKLIKIKMILLKKINITKIFLLFNIYKIIKLILIYHHNKPHHYFNRNHRN